jgi:hypothetical protein
MQQCARQPAREFKYIECARADDAVVLKVYDHDDFKRPTQLLHQRGRPTQPTSCSRANCMRSTLALAPRARLCTRRLGSTRRPRPIQGQDHRQAAASPPPRASPLCSPQPALRCPTPPVAPRSLYAPQTLLTSCSPVLTFMRLPHGTGHARSIAATTCG